MSRAVDSSPLATIDDIHRRLLRPPSLYSPDDDHAAGQSSSQSKANFTPIPRNQETKHGETMKKKLEDYLDPVLLSAISSKVKDRIKNIPQTRTKSKRDVEDFEWPVDELKVFVKDSRTEKKRNEAANLNDHLNLIADGGDTDEEDEFCTPFRQCEQIELKRFKR